MTQVEPTSASPVTLAHVEARLRRGPDRLLDVGHAKLAAWSFGEGPDVVCVHGWPLHAATWRELVPRLADRFRVHLFDLPGVGHSAWDEGSRIDVRSHAASVKEAVGLLGLRRFAYVAHDSGAAITRLAAADDARVFAGVMGNTEIPGHTPWQLGVYVAAARWSPVYRAFLAGMAVGPLRRSALGFGGCFTDARFADGAFGDWFVKPLVGDRRVARGQRELVRHLDADILRDVLEAHGRIAAPTLAVWGSDDPFFPIEKARPMLEGFRGGAELVEIPRGKLFAHEDHPEAFAAATRRFLERHA